MHVKQMSLGRTSVHIMLSVYISDAVFPHDIRNVAAVHVWMVLFSCEARVTGRIVNACVSDLCLMLCSPSSTPPLPGGQGRGATTIPKHFVLHA